MVILLAAVCATGHIPFAAVLLVVFDLCCLLPIPVDGMRPAEKKEAICSYRRLKSL